MWIIVHEDLDNAVNTLTVWDDMDAALMDTCASIVHEVQTRFDMTDPLMQSDATIINDYIRLQNYKDAIDHWNDCSNTYGIDVYWTVEHHYVNQAQSGRIPGLINLTPPPPPPPTLPVVSANLQTCTAPALPASSNGATCRGCQTHNEFAQADKPDGTYACYSCRTFRGCT